MNNFWQLVGFEYKKVWKRKSTLFSLIIIVFVCTFAMVGDALMGSAEVNGASESNLTAIRGDRAARHSVAGYLDQAKIDEVISKNAAARDTLMPDGAGAYPPEVYEECIRPYGGLRNNLIRMLSPWGRTDYEAFNRLDSGDGFDYYAMREQKLKEIAELRGDSPRETEAVMQMNARVKTPYTHDYFEGFRKFLVNMSTSALFAAFAILIVVAPIFSNEYATRVDQLILSSKNGKSSAVAAKLFSALSIAAVLVLLAVLLAFGSVAAVYGTFGGGVSFQLFQVFSVYPLTMLQAALVYCGVFACAALFLSSLVLLLSVHMKAPFGTIIAAAVLLFGSLFLSLQPGAPALNLIIRLTPAKMLDSNVLFSEQLAALGGIYVEPYLLVCVFCLLASAVLLPFVCRGFRRHQAG